MDRIPEEDWKIFKRHHLIAHEIFCESANAEVKRLIEDSDTSIVDKFQSIARIMKKFAKKEDELFLDYRRSTAMLYLQKFVIEDLLTSEQLEEYSEEIQKWLN